jgi:hypothetical protein
MPESTRHREAFDLYCCLGPDRSIPRLREELARTWRKPPSARTLFAWSSQYRWQFRLDEYERKAREAADEARIAAVREANERHLKEGLFLQQKATEWLTKLEADSVSAEAATRALVEGIRIERLVRGEPTERTALSGRVDSRLKEVSDAELDRLFAAAERASLGDGSQEPE